MTLPAGGERVMALFRMSSHCSAQGHCLDDDAAARHMPVAQAMLRSRWPRIGWSLRWMPATVEAEDDEGEDGATRVTFQHPHWVDWADGERVAPPTVTLPASRLQALDAELCQSLGDGFEPMLSLVEVRWGNLQRAVAFDPGSWGAVGSTVSPGFVGKLHDHFYVLGGRAVEVLSIFVSCSRDLAEVSETFVRSQLRGRHVAAMFFLWAAHNGDLAEAGNAYVEPAALFGLMRRFESLGIPTRWPHTAALSELLAAKSWMPAMSLGALRVPATTRVGRASIVRDPALAARAALAALRQRAVEQGLAAASESESCVVTKAGFTYEARAVVDCIGAEELGNALRNLSDQFPFHDVFFVQARVPDVALEARVGVVRGAAANCTCTRMEHVSADGYFHDFVALPRDEAVERWLGGDEAAMRDAEAQIAELCAGWWRWLLAESAEDPVSVRVDFLVRRPAPGRAEVWTCEVGELGYSTVGWEAFPGRVLPEVFVECLSDIACEADDCGCQAAREHAKMLMSRQLRVKSVRLPR